MSEKPPGGPVLSPVLVIGIVLFLGAAGALAVFWVGRGEVDIGTQLPEVILQQRQIFDELNRAKAQAGEGKHEEALAVFDRIAREHADRPMGREAELFAAHMLGVLHRFEEAHQRYDRLATTATDEEGKARALIGAAEALSRAGEHDGAVQQLSRIIEELALTRPDQAASALVSLHYVHRRAGRDGLARAALGRVVDEFPGLEGSDARGAASMIEQIRLEIVTAQSGLIDALVKSGAKQVERIEGSEVAWSEANGPFLITTEVIVPTDTTLRIGPGTEVRFGAQGRLVIKGQIEAIGTSDKPIVFRPVNDDATQAMWPGLHVALSAPDGEPSRLEHVRFISAETAIGCVNGSLTMQHVHVQGAVSFGLHVYNDGVVTVSDSVFADGANQGIRCDRGGSLSAERVTVRGHTGPGINCSLTREPVSIVDSLIEDNGRAGVSFRNATSGILRDSRIRNNRGPGVLCRSQASPTLIHNTITGNQGDGVRASDGCTVNLENNRIAENQGDGIHVDLNCTGRFQGNTVEKNAGAGIRCVAGSSPQIVGNRILDNGDTGVWLLNGAAPTLTDNTLTGNKPLALRNHSPHEIDAGNNFWGTTDLEAVAEQIEDNADKDTWGKVNVTPLRTAPANPPSPIG